MEALDRQGGRGFVLLASRQSLPECCAMRPLHPAPTDIFWYSHAKQAEAPRHRQPGVVGHLHL